MVSIRLQGVSDCLANSTEKSHCNHHIPTANLNTLFNIKNIMTCDLSTITAHTLYGHNKDLNVAQTFYSLHVYLFVLLGRL